MKIKKDLKLEKCLNAEEKFEQADSEFLKNVLHEEKIIDLPSCFTSIAVSFLNCISSDTESVPTLTSASSYYEQEHSPLKKFKTQNRFDLLKIMCDRYS